jgi:cobalt-zinc-cadmium efflux system membrane fusion protein
MTVRCSLLRASQTPVPLLVTALCVALTAAACGGGTPQPAASDAPTKRTDVVELTPAAITQAGIKVQAVTEQTRTDQVTASGVIALDETRTARVGSLQEGLVLATRAQVGDRVGARQLLATMHGHAVHDAWAGYRKAIADRRRLEKELTFAIDAHERAKRLYADKAISLQEVQRAEVDRVSATEMVDVAKAEITRSVEELEHIGIDAPSEGTAAPTSQSDVTEEEIPVRSPIAGVVLERLVTPGTTVTVGAPMFVVSELSTLWAIAEIDESHLSRVKTGRPVEVRVAAYPGEVFKGTITFIADLVNPKTRRITVRSTVPNPANRLKPEMFATISLGEGDPRPVVVVPRGAVQTIEGRPSVFVAEAGGRFVPRAITLGAEADGLVEAASGLAVGERVAVAGAFALKSELLKSAGGED